jgi:hypothetical protein
MKTQVGSLASWINANQEKTNANLKEIPAEMMTWKKEMTACQEATEVCLESMKPASEEIESESEHQEVPKEEETVETVKALRLYGDWHLAIPCRLRLKKQIQGYGGFRKCWPLPKERCSAMTLLHHVRDQGGITLQEEP